MSSTVLLAFIGFCLNIAPTSIGIDGMETVSIQATSGPSFGRHLVYNGNVPVTSRYMGMRNVFLPNREIFVPYADRFAPQGVLPEELHLEQILSLLIAMVRTRDRETPVAFFQTQTHGPIYRWAWNLPTVGYEEIRIRFYAILIFACCHIIPPILWLVDLYLDWRFALFYGTIYAASFGAVKLYDAALLTVRRRVAYFKLPPPPMRNRAARRRHLRLLNGAVHLVNLPTTDQAALHDVNGITLYRVGDDLIFPAIGLCPVVGYTTASVLSALANVIRPLLAALPCIVMYARSEFDRPTWATALFLLVAALSASLQKATVERFRSTQQPHNALWYRVMPRHSYANLHRAVLLDL